MRASKTVAGPRLGENNIGHVHKFVHKVDEAVYLNGDLRKAADNFLYAFKLADIPPADEGDLKIQPRSGYCLQTGSHPPEALRPHR